MRRSERLSLWESWREAPERARTLTEKRKHTAIVSLWQKSLRIAVWRLFRAGLALSVTPVACHCPGCGSQRLLRCRSHPAGRGPNSSSLFPPLAAVVAVAPKGRGLGKPGHFLLDARGPIWRNRAGLATEGSGFWTSAPCQAVAGLDSGALQPTKRINFARSVGT